MPNPNNFLPTQKRASELGQFREQIPCASVIYVDPFSHIQVRKFESATAIGLAIRTQHAIIILIVNGTAASQNTNTDTAVKPRRNKKVLVHSSSKRHPRFFNVALLQMRRTVGL
jgi:hypothetical protein